MIARLLTAAVAIPLVFAAIFWLDEQLLYILFCVLCFGLLWEWAGLAGFQTLQAKMGYALVGAVLAFVIPILVPLHMLDLMIGLVAITWIVAAAVVVFFASMSKVLEREIVKRAFGYLICIGGVIAVGHLEHGPLELVGLLLIVWLIDTGAYFVGKAIGQRQLHSTVSPNKTWEGTIGGVVCGALCCIVVGPVLNWVQLTNVGWFVAILLFAVFGDLFESAVKRTADAKDSGNLLPGHGGLLDRLDSLLAVSPWAYLSSTA